MKRLVLSLLLIVCLSFSALTFLPIESEAVDPPLVVYGYVRDTNGNAVEGATVSIKGADGQGTVSGNDEPKLITDSLGGYNVDLNFNNGTITGMELGDVVIVTTQKGDLEGSSTIQLTSSANKIDLTFKETALPPEEETNWRLYAFSGLLMVAVVGIVIYMMVPRKDD